jgi:hypothetical protein
VDDVTTYSQGLFAAVIMLFISNSCNSTAPLLKIQTVETCSRALSLILVCHGKWIIQQCSQYTKTTHNETIIASCTTCMQKADVAPYLRRGVSVVSYHNTVS